MRNIIFRLVAVSIFLGCQNNESKELEMVPIDLDELTISQIHEAYRNGEYTSEALVKAYLERINTQDSILNAITYINPNAISEAKKLDEEFKTTGKLRPLHGIPNDCER